MINAELLKILACPECKGRLFTEEAESVYCTRCRVSYPVQNGVPLLLKEKAIKKGEVK